MFNLKGMVTVAVGTAAVVLFGASIRGEEALGLADLIETVERSVVRVETSDGIGSGFMADDRGIVVTNLHVVAGSREAKIIFQDGRAFSVTGILAQDEVRDLAILATDCPSSVPLPLASTLPRKGDSVVTFGAPAGLSFSASEGIISAIRSGDEARNTLEKEAGTWLQTTAPISTGNSGGPLVNRQGEVVGVNTFYVTRGQNLNFAISSMDISELLRAAATVASPRALGEAMSRIPKPNDESAVWSAIETAVRDYINAAKASADKLSEHTDQEIKRLEAELALMRSGRINRRLEYPKSRGYRKETVQSRPRYFFFSRETKESAIEELETQLDSLRKTHGLVSSSGHGLVAVAMVAGPELSLASPGSIGRVERISVSQVTGPKEFHGYIGRTRVSVQGIPTATLLTDQVLTEGIFLFSGVEVYETRIGTENRIARLTYVPNEVFMELGRKLFPETSSAGQLSAQSPSPPPSDAFHSREWKDVTGKFSIQARFVRVDGSDVELERDAGNTIKVPISRLSSEDQVWLKAHQ